MTLLLITLQVCFFTDYCGQQRPILNEELGTQVQIGTNSYWAEGQELENTDDLVAFVAARQLGEVTISVCPNLMYDRLRAAVSALQADNPDYTIDIKVLKDSAFVSCDPWY
ncbi:MAG: hypothetical protein AAGH76_11810 [Pseudomonadota bacterium]